MTYVLPSPVQTALLQACLLDGEARTGAVQRFREMTTIDALDPGSQRLLPLYYRRLVDDGADDPDLGRLKGVHRKAWYANLLLRGGAEEVVSTLHAAGIETLILKGAGLHASIYAHEPALRPLSDVDILVSAAQVNDAIGSLEAIGFSQFNELYGKSWPRYMHSGTYSRGLSEKVDLHVRPLRFQLDLGYTARCWSRSQGIMLGSAPTSTLDPTDHLLITIIHGMAPNTLAPCRWVTDATLLIRGGHIDWPRFADEAAATWYPRSVEAGLRYLASEMQVSVPEVALSSLRRPRPRSWRFLETLSVQPPSRGARILSALFVDYALASTDKGALELIRGYPEYMRVRSYRGWRGTATRLIRLAVKGIAHERSARTDR